MIDREGSDGRPLAAVAIGLFPAVAVTTRLDLSLALAGVLLVVLVGSKVAAALLAGRIPARIRLPAHLLIASVLVTAVTGLLRAIAPETVQALGIYLPLVAVSYLVLDQMAQSGSSVGKAALSGLATALLFAAALAVVALVRQGLGTGRITLFPAGDAHRPLLVPGVSRNPLRALALPAGAFLTVGYLLALVNWVRQRGDRSRSTNRSKGRIGPARSPGAGGQP